MARKPMTDADRERLRNAHKRDQNDLITLSSAYSLWRDRYQWILYYFPNSRYTKSGKLKDLPSGESPNRTYHPRLEQLVDYLVENDTKAAEDLSMILGEVVGLKDEIKNMLEGYLEPIGVTPADAAHTLRNKLDEDSE